MVWNYYDQLPFILRCGRLNGLIIHHFNFIETDDRRINLMIRELGEHSGMHARITDLRKQIRVIYAKSRVGELSKENEIRWRVEEIHKLASNRENTSKLQVIIEGVRESLAEGKVYITG